MPKLNVSRRAFAAARAGAVAIVALGLFASSPYTNEARAIDIGPNAVNARLVFGPTLLGAETPDYANLCAWNLSNQEVSLIFQFDQLVNGNSVSSLPYKLAPHEAQCTGGGSRVDFLGAEIIFTSPSQCSQATQYPGNCGVVGTLEVVYAVDDTAAAARHLVHVDPVFVPGLPGSPRINPVPLPQ